MVAQEIEITLSALAREGFLELVIFELKEKQTYEQQSVVIVEK